MRTSFIKTISSGIVLGTSDNDFHIAFSFSVSRFGRY